MAIPNFTHLLLLACFTATAQTTTTHPPATDMPHRRVTITGRLYPQPIVPKNIPTVTGPIKFAFALRYQDITIGTGDLAAPGRLYTVHYTGWLEDGTKFDSSLDRQPIEFQQGAHRVIPGWDLGFEGMHVGGKRRLFIPWQLAYGEQGRGQIPPRANLIFDVELIGQRDLNIPAPVQAPAPH